ncbi:hypothetical protein GCM10009593_00130 [Microlunatus antarcticus]
MCSAAALAVVLAVQVASAPPAQARYPYGTPRDTRVTMRADEVLTVDVLGVDDPAVGATWVRSSVCLGGSGDSCIRQLSVGGLGLLVNDDGTVTAHATAGAPVDGGTTVVDYAVSDTLGGRYGARLRVTVQPGPTRAADPDPAVRARLRVTAWKRFVYFDHAGQVVRLTSTVANTGDVALEGLTVTSGSPSIPARTCSPVPVGGTLAARASTTCTALVTVTQDLVDLNVVRVDTSTVTGRAVRNGVTYRASAASIASASPVQEPRLALTASVDPATVTTATQLVAYTFVARNNGKVTLRNLLVRAPFHGLSALVCAPVPLGGTLPPGDSTTCRATRRVPPDLLGRATLTDTAKGSGQTYFRTRNAASAVSLALTTRPAPPPEPVAAPAPVARADTVSTTVGHPVVVDVLGNDAAGSPAVPLVGTSVRLRLMGDLHADPQLYGDAKTLIVRPVFNRAVDPLVGGAAFLVSGRGEITVVPLSTVPTDPLTIGYQVADANGRTTRSTLTVTVTP